MKLCLISDTHEKHEQLEIPPCDVLIHAGDFTMNGKEEAIRKFGQWLDKQPCDYALVIAGNHDLPFDQYRKNSTFKLPRTVKEINGKPAELLNNMSRKVLYIEDYHYIINEVTFYGSPWQLPFGYDWAFNATEDDLKNIYKDVKSADVLITHGPPFQIYDIGLNGIHGGSQELRNLVYRINPKIHVFGHFHGMGGFMKHEDKTLFVNAAMVNEKYKIVNKPIVVEI